MLRKRCIIAHMAAIHHVNNKEAHEKKREQIAFRVLKEVKHNSRKYAHVHLLTVVLRKFKSSVNDATGYVIPSANLNYFSNV